MQKTKTMKFENLPIGFCRDAGHKIRDAMYTIDRETNHPAKLAYWGLVSIAKGMATGGYLDHATYPDPKVFDLVQLLQDELRRFTWDPGDDDDVACQVAMAEFEAKCKHEFYDYVTEFARRAILPKIMAKFPGAKSSFLYCGICGHTPKRTDKPNLGPIRWYDPDDGHVFGTLCQACAYNSLDDQPKHDDFCVRADGSIPVVTRNTDEDISALLPSNG